MANEPLNGLAAFLGGKALRYDAADGTHLTARFMRASKTGASYLKISRAPSTAAWSQPLMSQSEAVSFFLEVSRLKSGGA